LGLDILGLDILGLDILGLDILGLDILGMTQAILLFPAEYITIVYFNCS